MLHDLHVIKKCDSKSRYGSIGQYKSTENYIIGTVSKTSKNGLYSSFSTPILLQKKSQKKPCPPVSGKSIKGTTFKFHAIIWYGFWKA